MATVTSLPMGRRNEAGVCGDWSVKDILSHLHAWHGLFFTWYRDGMAGSKPAIPAPGFSFKDTPALNEKIYRENRDCDYADVESRIWRSHQQLMAMATSHSDTELFTKQCYPWTGSTSLGAYFIGSLSSHYEWARGLVKKWKHSLAI